MDSGVPDMEACARAPRVSARDGAGAALLAFLGTVSSLSAVAASSCCALPIALAAFGLGVGGLGNLGILALFRAELIGLSALLLLFGWIAALWRRRTADAASRDACRSPARGSFVVSVPAVATLLVILAAVGPWLEPAAAGWLAALGTGT